MKRLYVTEAIPGWDGVGWLLVSPSAVQDAWQSRAIPMALIPLLPHELDARLSGGDQQAPPHDEAKLLNEARLLNLVAQGRPKRQMAKDLHISIRTLDRRLHVLRESFGVRSLAELAAAAARRGFGSSNPPTDGGRGSHS
jgi:DNA-binding NarL/FixJ family response regulator